MTSSVEQHDCPTRFLVRSRSRGTVQHLVDIAAFDGNGECSCEQFTYSMRRTVELAHSSGQVARLRCWHIDEARETALALTLKQHAKKEQT